jgi:hypothetical protein
MGWSKPVHGTDAQGKHVTASFGDGRNKGETLLSDGHKDPRNFMHSDQHDHYGRGDGPNNNAKSRGQYTGKGS